MGEFVKLSVILAVVCSICTALLAFVDGKTRIQRESAGANKKLAGAMALLPGYDSDDAVLERDDEKGIIVLRRKSDGSVLGAAIESSCKDGYAGAISLLVGFDRDGQILDYVVLSSQETPGLGEKISSDGFRAGFRKKSYTKKMRVKKDGGEIDAITSATISSRAACKAVNVASEKFKALIESSSEKGGNEIK